MMKKILIAEDDKFLASAYRFKLEKVGYEVKIAVDGVECLETLKTFIPDILILDLVMPKKDGFFTLAEIKADEKYKNIPVLIASNLEQKEDIDKGMGMGAIGYVIKSNMSLDELVTKIASVIENKI